MTITQSDVPCMWYDTSPTDRIDEAECVDCNSLYEDPALLKCDNLADNTIQDISTYRYRLAPNLFVQPLDSLHSVVCNPIDDGRVGVLNAEALHLLDLFRSPRLLAEAIMLSDWPPALIRSVARRFVQLGFLENEHAMPTPPEATSQTLTAWVHVSNACQLRCDYCYLAKTKEAMSHETARQAVDAIFRSATRHDFRRVKLKFAGGEPSLNLDVVTAAYDYAAELAQQHNLGLDAVIISNGVGWKQSTITALAERKFRIVISLDGLGDGHDNQRRLINGTGSAKLVLRTVEQLYAAGVVPQFSITISDRNLDEIPELMRYLLARDLPFMINYYRENDCSQPHIDLSYRDQRMISGMKALFAVIEECLPRRSLLGCLVDRANLNVRHQHGCGVGHNYMVVDQHGGIAKCQMDIQRTVANISFVDPLAFVKADKLGVQNVPVDTKEGCQTCQWRYWCAGGCSFLTHRATGRYDVKSPNCAIYKALYPEVLRLEGLRLMAHVPVWSPEGDLDSTEARVCRV